MFFRIGAFTIGGGLAMLPLIEHEVVERKAWVDRDSILDIFAVAQSLPGVIAINSSIYIGYRVAGFRGAVCSAIGVIMPSLMIILTIAAVMRQLAHNPYVQKAFAGVRSGVTALILLAVLRLGRRTLESRTDLALALAAMVLVLVFDAPVWLIIIGGGCCGLILMFFRRQR